MKCENSIGVIMVLRALKEMLILRPARPSVAGGCTAIAGCTLVRMGMIYLSALLSKLIASKPTADVGVELELWCFKLN